MVLFSNARNFSDDYLDGFVSEDEFDEYVDPGLLDNTINGFDIELATDTDAKRHRPNSVKRGSIFERSELSMRPFQTRKRFYFR